MIALLLAIDLVLLASLAFRGEIATARATAELEPRDPRVVSVFTALESYGLTAALDSLERRASSDSLVLRSAHQLAHALGRRALLRSGGDVVVLQGCRPAFASGCYHGVVEALLSVRGRIDMACRVGRRDRKGRKAGKKRHGHSPAAIIDRPAA